MTEDSAKLLALPECNLTGADETRYDARESKDLETADFADDADGKVGNTNDHIFVRFAQIPRRGNVVFALFAAFCSKQMSGGSSA
jgi:hypothetical protein